jgi:hypothetical protein
VIISKQLIIAELRRRGESRRAEFVDRQLPAEVDTTRHGGLLATLRLDPQWLAAASEQAAAEAAGEAADEPAGKAAGEVATEAASEAANE